MKGRMKKEKYNTLSQYKKCYGRHGSLLDSTLQLHVHIDFYCQVKKMENHPVWEDRAIKFDVANLHSQLRGGENALCNIDSIEDTKGNPGDNGKILITNLRIIWYSVANKKFNLTIGFARVITLSTKTVLSKMRGTTQALYVLAAGVNMRFEFLFTDLSVRKGKESAFAPIFDIYRIYQQTTLYRELKLRGAIVQSGQLNVLQQEQVYSTLNGVWNLSSDQGNLGSFIITNIRLVWFADINETFNISLPYMQMAQIKIRESKYGPALVVQTTETGGGYVLGFRIDPQDRLADVYKELKSLYTVYSQTPNFGVIYKPNNNSTNYNDDHLRVDDFEEISQEQEKEISTKFNAYLAEGSNTSGPRAPVYCKELGFAMEKIKDGYKLSDLWEIVPQNDYEK